MKRESGAHPRHREARLRPASAHLFPGITPGIWVQAATMADIVWARRLQRGEGTLGGRTLDPEHFEFRNEGTATEDASLRRRSTDRLRTQGD
jgi:hypothetical protein